MSKTKFLDSCISVTNALTTGIVALHQNPGLFTPILEKDQTCNEVSVSWKIGNSELVMHMGRIDTIPHQEIRTNARARRPLELEIAKRNIQGATTVNKDIRDALCKFLTHLVDWGYIGELGFSSTYPIPTILFNKRDAPIGAISIIEVTHRGSHGNS